MKSIKIHKTGTLGWEGAFNQFDDCEWNQRHIKCGIKGSKKAVVLHWGIRAF